MVIFTLISSSTRRWEIVEILKLQDLVGCIKDYAIAILIFSPITIISCWETKWSLSTQQTFISEAEGRDISFKSSSTHLWMGSLCSDSVLCDKKIIEYVSIETKDSQWKLLQSIKIIQSTFIWVNKDHLQYTAGYKDRWYS